MGKRWMKRETSTRAAKARRRRHQAERAKYRTIATMRRSRALALPSLPLERLEEGSPASPFRNSLTGQLGARQPAPLCPGRRPETEHRKPDTQSNQEGARGTTITTHPSMTRSGGWSASKDVAHTTCPPADSDARSVIVSNQFQKRNRVMGVK